MLSSLGQHGWVLGGANGPARASGGEMRKHSGKFRGLVPPLDERPFDLLARHTSQKEHLTARDDGGQQSAGIGSRQDDHNARGRLLQRLEESVSRPAGGHLKIGDDADASASL